MTVYYVAGMEANFHNIKDAIYAASVEAVRTRQEQTVMVDDGADVPYCYCRISDGGPVVPPESQLLLRL